MKKSINLASLNCNDLNRIGKILNLRDISSLNKIDICFLQETHFYDAPNILYLVKKFFLKSHLHVNKTS